MPRAGTALLSAALHAALLHPAGLFAQHRPVAPVQPPPIAVGQAGAIAGAPAASRELSPSSLQLRAGLLSPAPAPSLQARSGPASIGKAAAGGPTASAELPRVHGEPRAGAVARPAEGEAPRAAMASLQAATPSSEVEPSPAERRLALEKGLDALFDNRRSAKPDDGRASSAVDPVVEPPKARALLERAASRGVPFAALAAALRSAESQSAAAANLAALGVLGPGEYSPKRSLDFHYALLRLWHEVSPAEALPVDRSLPVPALTARKDGITYFIHGVVHGQVRPAGRGRVRSLVERLQSRGLPLYSEQNLPAAYGFSWGWETLDHASQDGSPARLRPAFETAGGPLRRAVARLIDLAAAPGSLLAPLAWLAGDPASPWAWLLLAALAAGNLAILTSLLPWRRFLSRLAAERAERELSDEDMAHHYRAHAALAQRAASTVEGSARVELPMPLKLDLPEPIRTEQALGVSRRSKAIADAVAADAAKTGASEVHVLVGINHAHEVAWHLKT